MPGRAEISLIDLLRLLELIGHAIEAGLRVGLIALRARPAHPNRPDGQVAEFDRQTAARADYVGKIALWRQIRIVDRALGPLRGRTTEGQCRIGLAPGQLEIMRARGVALQEHPQPAG